MAVSKISPRLPLREDSFSVELVGVIEKLTRKEDLAGATFTATRNKRGSYHAEGYLETVGVWGVPNCLCYAVRQVAQSKAA